MLEQSLQMATLENTGYFRSRRDSSQAKPTKMQKIVLFQDQDPTEVHPGKLKEASGHRAMIKPEMVHGLAHQSPVTLLDFGLRDGCYEDDIEEVLNLLDHPEISWSDIQERAPPTLTGRPIDGADSGLPVKSILRLPLPAVGAIRLGKKGRSILELDRTFPSPTCHNLRKFRLLNW